MPSIDKKVLDVSDAEFKQRLKQALLLLPHKEVPLHWGTTKGGFVDVSSLDLTILSYSKNTTSWKAKVAYYFGETMVGCSCGFEAEPEPAYCEMELTISRVSGEVVFLPAG